VQNCDQLWNQHIKIKIKRQFSCILVCCCCLERMWKEVIVACISKSLSDDLLRGTEKNCEKSCCCIAQPMSEPGRPLEWSRNANHSMDMSQISLSHSDNEAPQPTYLPLSHIPTLTALTCPLAQARGCHKHVFTFGVAETQ
jgi:hypothetical protein